MLEQYSLRPVEHFENYWVFRKILNFNSIFVYRTSASLFGNLAEIFKTFGQNRQGCQNCILFVCCNFLRKSIVLKSSIVISYLRSVSDDFLDHRSKKSRGVFKASFNVPTETFCQKTSTFGKKANFCFFCGLLSNNFPQGCQSGILKVQSNISSSFIGNSSDLSSYFEREFFDVLSIKLYHCSQKRIQYAEKNIRGKFFFFVVPYFSSDRRRIFSSLTQLHRQGC